MLTKSKQIMTYVIIFTQALEKKSSSLYVLMTKIKYILYNEQHFWKHIFLQYALYLLHNTKMNDDVPMNKLGSSIVTCTLTNLAHNHKLARHCNHITFLFWLNTYFS